MVRCMIAFGLLLLVQSVLTTVAGADEGPNVALRGRQQNGVNTLEDIMTKLGAAITKEQNKKKGSAEDSNFSRRLVGEQMKKELLSKTTTMDSMKEALVYLSEAQEHQEDLEAVALNLKKSIGKIHAFLNVENSGRRLVEATITGAAFEESVKGLAKSLGEDDINSYTRHAAVVKQGLRDAISKLHFALEDVDFEGREDLGPRLLSARNDPDMKGVLEGPVRAASAATKAVARLLDDPAVGGAQVSFEDATLLDYLGMMWILPLSIAGGTFLWAVIGIWRFAGVYPQWQILVLEIRWLMDIIGCVAKNEIACGAWTGAP